MHGTLHRESQCPACIAKAPVHERMQCIIPTRLNCIISSPNNQSWSALCSAATKKTHFRLVRHFMWLATQEAPATDREFEWEGGREHDTDDTNILLTLSSMIKHKECHAPLVDEVITLYSLVMLLIVASLSSSSLTSGHHRVVISSSSSCLHYDVSKQDNLTSFPHRQRLQVARNSLSKVRSNCFRIRPCNGSRVFQLPSRDEPGRCIHTREGMLAIDNDFK
jgi:hypothetical protein